MSKPQNVIDHWHYFPQNMVDKDDNDNYRLDICRISDNPFYVVWILETDVSIPFTTFIEAKTFVKDFILGRHAKPAVDMNNDLI
jgi:hypothetical protein